MANELVRSKLEKTLQVKSLTDLVRARTSEEALLLIDVSGSMSGTPVERLKEVVRDVQRAQATKMIAFGGRDGGAYMVDSVPPTGGGTPLTQAINLARSKNAGRCVVISDGCPDNPSSALQAAKEFGGRIDVVYIGSPGDYGEDFMKQLAAATGGTEFTGKIEDVKQIAAKVSGFLTAGDDDDDDDDERKVIAL